MKKISAIFALVFIINIINAQTSEPELILVEGGTYKMGNTESNYFDEYPDHLVSINSFYIGKYEVSIEEYKGFSRTAGLTLPEGDPKMPATNVSWENAVMYCNWLSRSNGLDKCYKIIRDNKNKTFKVVFDREANGYRLPTEAEWEYAARGGIHKKNYAYSGSDNASDVAWYSNTGKMLHKTGEKKANDLGIYDMTGNCQEWCFDIYLQDFYRISPKENPICDERAAERVSRGGNFSGHEETLRISKRFYNATDFKNEILGFRIARNQ